MDNMEELSIIIYITKLFIFGISTYKCSKPIISYNERRETAELAEEFKDTLGEDCHLFKTELSVSICIDVREDFLIVQEVKGDSFHIASVHSTTVLHSSNPHLHLTYQFEVTLLIT
jgi:hypothetical protein